MKTHASFVFFLLQYRQRQLKCHCSEDGKRNNVSTHEPMKRVSKMNAFSSLFFFFSLSLSLSLEAQCSNHRVRMKFARLNAITREHTKKSNIFGTRGLLNFLLFQPEERRSPHFSNLLFLRVYLRAKRVNGQCGSFLTVAVGQGNDET